MSQPVQPAIAPPRLPVALAVATIAGGAMSFAARPLGLPQVAGGHDVTIAPGAALAAIAAGLGPLALGHGRPRAATIAGVAAAVLGVVTLAGQAAPLDVFDAGWASAAVTDTDPLGAIAAAGWLLTGAAIAAAAGTYRRATPALGLAAMAVAVLPLTSALLGSGGLDALASATLLLAAAVAVVVSVPEREPMATLLAATAAGTLARRVVPLVPAVPLVLGYAGRAAGAAANDGAARHIAWLGTALVVAAAAGLWRAVAAVRIRERALVRAHAELGAEHAARLAGEARLHAFLQQLPIGAGLCDVAGRWIHTNPSLGRFVDCDRPLSDPAQTARWHAWDEHGQPVPRSAWPAARALSGETAPGMEFRHTLEDGTAIWTRVTAAPFRGPDGAVAGVLAVVQDIDEQKRAEEALAAAERQLRLAADHDRQRAEDALRDAVARRDHFLAMLAHELRNPLAPLVSSLSLLHSGGDAASVDALRQTMERQVGLMVRLIDDLMDISRLAFDALGLQRSVASLGSIVRDAVDACRPALDAAVQRLDVTLPPHPVYVYGDPARLAQSLGNLIGNAGKFSPRGARVTVEAVVIGEDVVLRVRDRGIGLTPEAIPRMFDMFAQADASLERSRGGLGIGLGLARQLVEMHGGTITASSAGPGHGSEFTIHLPDAVREAPVRAETPAVPAPLPPGLAMVLVVDDNRDAALSLGMTLEAHGLDVQVAHDGRQALAAAAARPPDAVLLDIGLPGLNGYDVCREMRRHAWGERAVIVAMTGWGQQQDRRRSAEAGFDDHLVKPVAHETLLRTLARSAAGARRQAGRLH